MKAMHRPLKGDHLRKLVEQKLEFNQFPEYEDNTLS